jgi:hypothetical protein
MLLTADFVSRAAQGTRRLIYEEHSGKRRTGIIFDEGTQLGCNMAPQFCTKVGVGPETGFWVGIGRYVGG